MKARTDNVKRARGEAARSRRKPAVADKQAAAHVAPAAILVNPQLGENIGFAARALANFGLDDLRLVEPRDGWPNDKAHAAAAGAAFVVEQAKVYPDTEAAIADLNFVLATTARPREMVKPVLSPESAARELVAARLRGERSGILFGPERSGLDNDTIALADAVVIAPVSLGFASLSLPQAVLIVAYEWLKAQNASPALGRVTKFDGPTAEGLAFSGTRKATRAELLGLFAHLEAELDRAGFFRPPEKRAAMVRSIRNMFHRMGATEQDVHTWRGIVAALAAARKGPRP
jgi:tRNA/rRNA methyltransferase